MFFLETFELSSENFFLQFSKPGQTLISTILTKKHFVVNFFSLFITLPVPLFTKNMSRHNKWKEMISDLPAVYMCLNKAIFAENIKHCALGNLSVLITGWRLNVLDGGHCGSLRKFHPLKSHQSSAFPSINPQNIHHPQTVYLKTYIQTANVFSSPTPRKRRQIMENEMRYF